MKKTCIKKNEKNLYKKNEKNIYIKLIRYKFYFF